MKEYLFLMIVLLFSLSCGCQTVEKKGGMAYDANYRYTYDTDSNQTYVVMSVRIKNDSIFRIKTLYINYDVTYEDGTTGLVKKTFDNVDLRNGYDRQFNTDFYLDGKVKEVKWVSWGADYKNLWSSYMVWFIVAIIGIIAGVIIVKANDLDAEEAFDVVFFAFMLINIAGFAIPWIRSTIGWVPIVIVDAALVIMLLICKALDEIV